MIKRAFAAILCLIMVFSLLPTAALAAGTGKAIQLVNPSNPTGGIAGYNSGYNYIYMGNFNSASVKWRVLDDETNTGGGYGFFLLSEDLLEKVPFDLYNNSNDWQGSNAQAWCKDFAGIAGDSVPNAFSTAELAAILATTKSDTSAHGYGASQLSGEKVFFLSAEEACNTTYGFNSRGQADANRAATYRGSPETWWLRSPSAKHFPDEPPFAGSVNDHGSLTADGVMGSCAARPAFNLDLNSVLFTSAAADGKSGAVGSDAIFEIPASTTTEWKLTLKDSSRSFTVTETAATGKPGDTITLHYSGATIGGNEYISAIIEDTNGAQYYGRLLKPTTENGTVDLIIPETLAPDDYTLNLFSEQYNGDYKTDYASDFATVTLTVEPVPVTDITMPSASAVVETNLALTATVEPSNATKQDITWSVEDARGTGASITGSTFLATTPGKAKIKATIKDGIAVDTDFTKTFDITVQAKTYTVTVSASPTAGGTVSGGGSFTANASVNLTATPNFGYRFVKWTENGNLVSTAAMYSFTVTKNSDLVAVFEAVAPVPTGGTSSGIGSGYIAPAQNSAQNAKGDIRLTGPNVPRGDTLLTPSTQNGALMKLLGGDTLIGMWDIKLRSGRTSIPGSTLSFNVGRENAGKSYTLYHLKADGTKESFSATADAEGIVSFYPINELSPFMLVEGSGGAATTSIPDVPATGDMDTGLALLLLSIAGMAVVLVKRRKGQA